MRKPFAILLAGALAMTATSCAESKETGSHTERIFKLSDGREVLCISTTLIGSFSCDWGNAR